MQNSETVIDIGVARRLREASSPKVTGVSQVLKRVDVAGILGDGIQLYFSNIDPMYHEDAADFIRALFDTRKATIHHQGAEVSELSVIRTIDSDGTVLEIFLREFTALTRSDGEVSSRNLRESSWWLQENNISVSYFPNSVYHDRRAITDEELEGYRYPDKIDIVQGILKYTVNIMSDSGDEEIGSATVSKFSNPTDCSLLDMILCAFDYVTTYNRLPLEDYRIHILSAEGHRQSITRVFTPEEIESIVYPRLKETGDIYTRLPYEEAWKHYFRTRVISKLRGK